MAGKPRNRVVLAAVLGLELGLLAWGIYVLVGLFEKGIRPVNLWQLVLLLAAMVVIYLLYLKKEKEQVEDRVVGEKFRTGALLDALPLPAMMLDGEGTVLAANPRAARALGVDELELAGAAVGEAVGGDLGRRLAEGAAGSFVAAAREGRQLRCTASPVGGAAGALPARLIVLEPQGAQADSGAQARPAASAPTAPAAPTAAAAPAQVAPACGRYMADVAPLLERTANHLAMLSVAARASSPHEATRAAQLGGVALRLAQAARRIRLAREIELLAAGALAGSLRPEEFDYSAMVRDAIEKVEALFNAAGVELAVEAPEAALPVRADRSRMELVLRDLLEVALAMTSEGGRVTVRAVVGSGEAEVSVTDTGCGMRRDELEAVFSADGKPPVQEAYTGGVRDGLQVAREIIEASGGQLWAESAPGRGTRFSLRIPGA